MDKPCGKKMLNDHGEPWCLDHGTRKFVVRATDIKGVDEPIVVMRNSGSKWTDEEISLLIEMTQEGMTIAEVAEVLNRTENAVYYKLWSISKNV